MPVAAARIMSNSVVYALVFGNNVGYFLGYSVILHFEWQERCTKPRGQTVEMRA